MDKMSIYELTDKDIGVKMGEKLKNIRINANFSQKKLAENSSLSIMTISGMETGRTVVSTIALIRILRALDKLDIIEHVFLQPEPISPALLYQIERKKRKRTSKK
jgi:transcriptional regulator with XRE-family HTH domain